MTTDEVKMLIFGLDGEKYSTDIKAVERILGYDAPNFVKGVINYEDSILPIISLSEKFNLGLDKESETRQIIVVKRQEKKFGIIVENVYEVRDIDESLIEEAPAITGSKERKYISGLIRLENNIVILLDLEKILTTQDEENIF